jgi:hypothetical protein
MAKEKGQKDKQHNDQKKRDRRTNNTMTKRKVTEGQTTQWPKKRVSCSFGHCVACPSVLLFWLLCCLSFWHFLLVIALLVLLSFSFGHCVACPPVLFRKGQKDKQRNDQKKRTERQTTQWPKRKGTEEQATQWPKEKEQKAIVFSVLLCNVLYIIVCPFSFGHCIFCPSV